MSAAWSPSAQQVAQAQMTAFRRHVNATFKLKLDDYFELHAWSIKHPDLFWGALWDFMPIIGNRHNALVYQAGEHMLDARWFEGATLNFAENLLRRRDEGLAIIYHNEQGAEQHLSYADLYQQVALMTAYLRQIGIAAGDRIAACLPNCPETIVAMLATASIGAIWSSCSPDFGLQGLLDRFGQIEPKVIFIVDEHYYQGKKFNHDLKFKELIQQLPSVIKTIKVSYSTDLNVGHPNNLETKKCSNNKNQHIEKKSDKTIQSNNIINYTDIINSIINNDNTIEFTQLPFNHPLYILYSSGTTGKPKCMVHGAGGTLLQHMKELKLHCDLRENERLLFYTTCGWMMWNWMASALSVGATLVLYEGSPVFPNTSALFDIIDKSNVNVLGCGAKFLESVAKAGVKPTKTHSLKSLRCILTTGSPLLPDSFDYVYRDVKNAVQLSSISGGSDIISCFVLGNPTLPIYRGELQCLGLGMDVRVVNDQGDSIVQKKGELTCNTPFPSMPIYFWNDPDKKKYRTAYFETFPNIWAHGDYAEITAHLGMIIYGRSDATLNPSGVRVGTAEIYNQVEKIDDVIDCLAVGQQWQSTERIILFVVLQNGSKLDEDLINRIKAQIRNNTSPMHVPAVIIQAPDLPRTISGKTVEIAVKKLIHGQEINNVSALANPEVLDFFKNIKL